MYKATRELIKARLPYTEGMPLRCINHVEQISTGILRKCYSNAHNAKAEAAARGERVAMVSGWIVKPYDKVNNVVAIIAHWWNMDENGRFFDTTPLTKEPGEYVQDTQIQKFCVENDTCLDIHLVCSLLYENGQFSKLLDEERMLFAPIKDLRTAGLFAKLDVK